MNILINALLFFSFFSILSDTSGLEPDILPTLTEFRDCAFSTQILQLPFTINTPGLYCVGNNVTVFSQVAPAITINVPATNGGGNVILDLNNQTIQSIGNRFIQIGVLVQGQSNVVIRNGTLINFSEAIRINSTQNRVQTLLVEKVNLIQNNVGVNVVGSGGINLTFRKVTAFRSLTNGFVINTTTNCLFEECISSSNGFNNAGTASGFLIINSVLPTFINCQANDNTLHGYFLQGTQFAQFINCWAAQNSGNGFFLIPNIVNNNIFVGNNINNNLINCSAQNNQLNGFAVNGNGQSFYHCNALSNVQNGFALLGGTNHSILNSLAKLNLLAGILINAGVTECQIRKNTIIGNGSGLVNNGTSNSIYQNFANDNNPNFSGITNFAVSPAITDPINFTANIAE